MHEAARSLTYTIRRLLFTLQHDYSAYLQVYTQPRWEAIKVLRGRRDIPYLAVLSYPNLLSLLYYVFSFSFPHARPFFFSQLLLHFISVVLVHPLWDKRTENATVILNRDYGPA